ncbi:MAG TPA: SpoIIIAH-like family protein [Clostridiales bacterium]|nr:SpoIIIAH-like family protein [Clostridiales bacterium]
MNMIIGKRQIILAALVLGLGIAVYLNWQYSQVAVELPITDAIEQGTTNYGEAQYVDSPQGDVEDTNGETFFVEAKLSRQKARDEAAETLAAMLADANLDSEQKAELAMRAADLAESIEKEGKIENLIKAKGFTDVMVYYDTQRADVIIKTSGLLANEVAQIKDIILKETQIAPENISIVEIN